MNIELKKKHDIDPLLKELHKIKTLASKSTLKKTSGLIVRFKNSEVGFIDPFAYNKIECILMSSLSFKNSISSFSKGQIIRHTLNKIAKNNISNSNDFLNTINEEYEDYYRNKEESTFHLLTSLSINKLPFTSLNLNGCEIKIVGSDYPDKYKEHRAKQYQKRNKESEDSELLKIIISVKDRDINDAFDKAFSFMEIFRGFLCLITSSWRFPIVSKPINRIIYGGFYTLHDDNGKNVDDDFYWYEPNQNNIDVFKIENIDSIWLEKQTKKFISQFNKCHYKHRIALKNVIGQYVTAYDQINKDSCFIKAWTALENLVGTHRYDMLINRCIVGHKNVAMIKLELEALKTFRNELVHETNGINENESDVLTNCYMLIRFISHQISSNLKLAGKINSITEYASYLDYLYDKKAIDSLDEKYTGFNLNN